MITIFRRLRYLFGRSRHDADLLAEIEAHRALRQEAFEREGLAPEDAAHASQRALGNVALAVDDARDVWTIRIVDIVRQDVRAALRGLRKSPRFALSSSGQTDPVDGAYVSGRFFDELGVTAIRGRMITPVDDGGAAPDGA